MIPELNKDFWTNRYTNNEAGWDIGYPSPALIEFAESFPKSAQILIPGAGNSYEAEYLFNQGYLRVSVIDLSEIPLQNLKQRCPEFPDENLIQGNFFEHSGSYDLILEQTFFCALNPSLRNDYVHKMHSLLNTKGTLAGLLFNETLNADKPPFGGSEPEYRTYFEPYFEIKRMEICQNSIPPRANRELFFEMRKKS